ncbi:hypothetical protein F5Y13DRAFT_184508 [Hypoxylon sp. FL1857]|nr:hypothetical protein F5Y13DRAFT_184508 [Hypoxylon sp. FL1857]
MTSSIRLALRHALRASSLATIVDRQTVYRTHHTFFIPRGLPTKYQNSRFSTAKMVKDKQTVIQEFNELVNMSASDLETWLKEGASESAGWSKSDGSGETIGHESGRKIIEILKKNPDKDPDKYEQDDIDHMRRVVAYCKRHLAQEEKAKQDPDSKSARSLKNWGHDPTKE